MNTTDHTTDWPSTAIAVLPTAGDSRKIRLFATSPTILEIYLLFTAFSKTGTSVRAIPESQADEEIPLSSDVHELNGDDLDFSRFYEIVATKGLNALTLVNDKKNFAYFDWDDRYFVVGGEQVFLEVCFPMTLFVGKMYFESMALDSPEEKELLDLWDSLSGFM